MREIILYQVWVDKPYYSAVVWGDKNIKTARGAYLNIGVLSCSSLSTRVFSASSLKHVAHIAESSRISLPRRGHGSDTATFGIHRVWSRGIRTKPCWHRPLCRCAQKITACSKKSCEPHELGLIRVDSCRPCGHRACLVLGSCGNRLYSCEHRVVRLQYDI